MGGGMRRLLLGHVSLSRHPAPPQCTHLQRACDGSTSSALLFCIERSTPQSGAARCGIWPVRIYAPAPCN